MKKALFNSLVKLKDTLPMKQLLPKAIYEPLRKTLMDNLVKKYPDRVYLENVLLPALVEKNFDDVLFVGTESYTINYGNMFRNRNTNFWTIDIEPDHEKWGEPNRHVVGNAITLDKYYQPNQFDAIVINGVLGFGINDDKDIDSCLSSAYTLLKKQGQLVLGWNNQWSNDPLNLSSITNNFQHGSLTELPQRKTFENVAHVFDMFTAKNFEQV